MSARRPKINRVDVIASDKAVEGQMDWAGGISSSFIRVGMRTLEPDM